MLFDADWELVEASRTSLDTEAVVVPSGQGDVYHAMVLGWAFVTNSYTLVVD